MMNKPDKEICKHTFGYEGGEQRMMMGYRFRQSDAEDLRGKLERQGHTIEIVETLRSGRWVMGDFHNTLVWELWSQVI